MSTVDRNAWRTGKEVRLYSSAFRTTQSNAHVILEKRENTQKFSKTTKFKKNNRINTYMVMSHFVFDSKLDYNSEYVFDWRTLSLKNEDWDERLRKRSFRRKSLIVQELTIDNHEVLRCRPCCLRWLCLCLLWLLVSEMQPWSVVKGRENRVDADPNAIFEPLSKTCGSHRVGIVWMMKDLFNHGSSNQCLTMQQVLWNCP